MSKPNKEIIDNKEIVGRADLENVQSEPKKLTLKQELFCRYYTSLGDTFGNRTTSYAKAYGYDLAGLSSQRVTEVVSIEGKEQEQEIIGSSEQERVTHYCQTAGSRLLSWYDGVNERIGQLMIENFNSDNIIDQRLTEIVLKGKDTDAIQAIKHRNDLKQRITKKLDVTTAGRPLAGMSDEELLKLAGGTD